MPSSDTKKIFPMSMKMMGGLVLFVAFLMLIINDDLVHINNAFKSDDDRTERILLIVSFEPTPRSPAIALSVTVDNTEVIHGPWRDDPWQQALIIPKGAEVHLTATQKQNGRLVCSIHQPGKMTFDARDDRLVAGTVSCWHNHK